VVEKVEDGMIEGKTRHQRDGHHVGPVLHHDPLHASNNVRVHFRNSTNTIHDDDLQSLWVLNHNHELCLRLGTVFVRGIHGPTVRIHNARERAIGDDAAVYAIIVSVVLWTALFIVVRASD
jgi:hypothetical protein